MRGRITRNINGFATVPGNIAAALTVNMAK